jgi:cytochrome b561
MALRNNAEEYGSAAKWLHWLIAVGIVVLLWLGLEQAGMERGPAKTALRETHGSIAVIVFVLMSIRLLWRFVSDVPADPPGTPAWQRVSARLVHWAIYLAVFVQLVSGPMTFATAGRPVPFFGLASISLPVAQSQGAHEVWEEVHETTWVVLAALLAVHVLAALHHHFVRKDDVLRRMTIGVARGGR